MSGSPRCRACAAGWVETVRPPSEAGFGPVRRMNSPERPERREHGFPPSPEKAVPGPRSARDPCDVHRATGGAPAVVSVPSSFLDAALLSATGRRERSRPPALAGRRREGSRFRNRVLRNLSGRRERLGLRPQAGKASNRRVVGPSVLPRLRTVWRGQRIPERGGVESP